MKGTLILELPQSSLLPNFGCLKALGWEQPRQRTWSILLWWCSALGSEPLGTAQKGLS